MVSSLSIHSDSTDFPNSISISLSPSLSLSLQLFQTTFCVRTKLM